jgi:RNA recognition motif-containing protein
MNSTNNCSTKIFIGNIPYDYQESELIETLEIVGPLKGSIDIKKDDKTGKPKGFGFCEYKDQESRISALKNLKSIEYNGRQLEVNTENNQKHTIISEENLRIFREFSFIKNSIRSISELSEEQKMYIFLISKILNDKYPDQFNQLLYNQNDEFLSDFLNFQEEFANKLRYKDETNYMCLK